MTTALKNITSGGASAPARPIKGLGSLPSYDQGSEYIPEDQIALLHEGESVIPKDQNPNANTDLIPIRDNAAQKLIQSDKEKAAMNGDLVGMGKAVINQNQFAPTVTSDVPDQISEREAPADQTKHQETAGGPLVAGAGTTYDKKTLQDFSGMERKAKLQDYDQRIQAAFDSGDELTAHELQRAKMSYEDQNPWGSQSNKPGPLGRIGHIAARIGNIAGDIVAPETLALIPGTALNRAARRSALGSAISADTENELRLAQADASEAKESPKPKLLTEAGNTYTAPDGTRYQRYQMPDGSAQWFPEGQAPTATTTAPKGPLGRISLPEGGFFGQEKPNTSEQDKNRWSTLLSKKQTGKTLSVQEQQDYNNLAPQFSIGQARAASVNKNIDAILKDRGIPKDQWDSYHVDADTAPDVAKDAERQADVRSNEVWASGQPERQQTAEERKQDEKDRRATVYAELSSDGSTVLVSQYDYDHANPGTYMGIAEPVKAGDLTKDRAAIRQLNDVQVKLNRYEDSIQKDMPNVSDEDRKLMTEVLSINNDAGGGLLASGNADGFLHISGAFPQWSAQLTSRKYDLAKEDLEKLAKNPAAMRVMSTYLGVAAAVPAYQKALTGIGRSNKEMLDLELQNVPMPYYDQRTSSDRIKSFQENVDQARSGFPKNLPGVHPIAKSSSSVSSVPTGATDEVVKNGQVIGHIVNNKYVPLKQ